MKTPFHIFRTSEPSHSPAANAACIETQTDTVSLKNDGTDGTAYTDGTAGLVADGTDYKDGTAIQLSRCR